MHKPVVSKIRVKNPNKSSTKHSNKGNLHYIATRPGVVLVNGIPDMNEKQEENFSKESTEEEYLQYIARRPRSHGLFGNIDTSNLAKLESEMYGLSKNRLIYRGITSLSEEDATELGYYKKKKWEQLLQATIPEIAAEFNIPIDRLNWVAAFHLEQSHPHVHYMFWDSKEHVLSPFIHVSKQNKCREIFSREIFREEREKAAVEKTVKRDLVLELGEKYLSTNINLLSSLFMEEPTNKIPGYVNNLPVVKAFSEEIQELIQSLPSHGRIAYGFLPPEVKQKVDAITDRVLQNNLDIRKEYLTYLDLAETAAKTYSPSAKNYSVADYKIKDAITNADRDIRKRISNLILNHAKQLRAENFPFPANLEEFFEQAERKEADQIIPISSENNSDEREETERLLSLSKEEPEGTGHEREPKEDSFPYIDDEALFMRPPASSIMESPSSDAAFPFYGGDFFPSAIDPLLLTESVPSAPRQAFSPLSETQAVQQPDSHPDTGNNDPYQPAKGKTNALPRDQTEGHYKSLLWSPAYKDAKRFLSPGSAQTPDFKKAYLLLQEEAQKGNALAAYDLGTMHQRGLGIAIDATKATEYFQKAFSLFLDLYQKGSDSEDTAYLCYRIGKMYLSGIGTGQDTRKAINYLSSAAASNVYAQYTLGKLLTDKTSVDYNLNKGVSYLKKAATAGNDFAQYRLGKLLCQKDFPLYDLDAGIEELKKASEKNPYAQYTLGTILLDEERPSFDPKAGLRYLTDAANSKERIAANAHYALGKYYLQEDSDSYNMERGLYYLNQAANAKNGYAEYQLGIFFLKGAGQDRTLGLSYLKESADNGNSIAPFALGKEYLYGKERDVELGKSYLNLAIQNGNEYAQLLLISYENMQKEQILNGSFQILYSIFDEFEKTNQRQESELSNHRKSISKQAAKELAKKAGNQKE